LSDSSVDIEPSGGQAIDEDSEGGRRDASHNPLNKYMGEAQMGEYHLQVEPINFIKRFCKINLKRNAFKIFMLYGV